jgi:integrase
MNQRGSIRKRGDSYQLRVMVGGRQHTKSVRVDTDDEANLEMARFVVELQVDGGLPVGSQEDMTVTELAEHYWTIEGCFKKGTTRRGYRVGIDSYIIPDLGPLPVAEIQPVTLRRWFAELANGQRAKRGKGLSASSLNNLKAPLSRMFALAKDMDIIRHNPVDGVRLPKVAKRDPTAHAITLEQFGRLIAHTRTVKPELATALHMAVAAGARRGEVCAWRWTDFDFEAGSCRIERTIVKDETGRWYEDPATKNYEPRNVTLDPTTVAVLRAHHAAMMGRAFACGTMIADDAFVFSDAGDCSTFWKADLLGAGFRRAAQAVGLRGMGVTDTRLHDLRHTFCTWLANADIAPFKIQAAAGHKTLAVTNSYVHARQADPVIAEAMGRALKGE